MSEVAVLGIDLGKTGCSVAGMSAGGQFVLRRRVARDGIPALLGEFAALRGGVLLRRSDTRSG